MFEHLTENFDVISELCRKLRNRKIISITERNFLSQEIILLTYIVVCHNTVPNHHNNSIQDFTIRSLINFLSFYLLVVEQFMLSKVIFITFIECHFCDDELKDENMEVQCYIFHWALGHVCLS